MKCVVGLGNPGAKYSQNRHNVGFMVVDQLAKKLENAEWAMTKKFNAEIILAKNYILVQPQTYMNDSGEAVSAICRFYKIKNEDLYIVHDDLDIAIGNYKIQHGKGPQVHNGLRSIEEKLGTDQFWNVRVGVENRPVRGNKGIPGMVYSLQDFTTEEKVLVAGVIDKVVVDLWGVLS